MGNIIKLENLALALAALVAYHQLFNSWWLLAIFILVPDISMLGYLINPRFGSICYNTVHTYIFAAVFLGIGLISAIHWMVMAGLILIVHIGIDRLFGYGLKYSDSFKHTHLDN